MIRSSTAKLSVTLSNAGEDTLSVRVVCDSVKGIDVAQTLHVTVTGNEEELKNAEMQGVDVKDAVDEALDEEQFDDDDIEYDEYLAEWPVCCTFLNGGGNGREFAAAGDVRLPLPVRGDTGVGFATHSQP